MFPFNYDVIGFLWLGAVLTILVFVWVAAKSVFTWARCKVRGHHGPFTYTTSTIGSSEYRDKKCDSCERYVEYGGDPVPLDKNYHSAVIKELDRRGFAGDTPTMEQTESGRRVEISPTQYAKLVHERHTGVVEESNLGRRTREAVEASAQPEPAEEVPRGGDTGHPMTEAVTDEANSTNMSQFDLSHVPEHLRLDDRYYHLAFAQAATATQCGWCAKDEHGICVWSALPEVWECDCKVGRCEGPHVALAGGP